MGEGEGGGGHYEDPLVPPPLHPLPPRGGEIFGGICLLYYGLINKCSRVPCFIFFHLSPGTPDPLDPFLYRQHSHDLFYVVGDVQPCRHLFLNLGCKISPIAQAGLL